MMIRILTLIGKNSLWHLLCCGLIAGGGRGKVYGTWEECMDPHLACLVESDYSWMLATHNNTWHASLCITETTVWAQVVDTSA